MRDASPPAAGTALYLAFALVLLNVPGAVALGLGIAPGVGAGLLMGTTWVLVDRRRARPHRPKLGRSVIIALGTALGGVALPILAASHLLVTVQLLSGRLPKVTLADLPTTDAAVLEVEGGAVRAELVGEHIADSDGRGYRTGLYAFAAPVVAPDWTRDVNVTAWLACDGGLDSPAAARAACASRLEDGVVSGSTTHASGRSLSDHAAIHDAIERHGLKSEGPVVILETSPDPARLAKGRLLATVLFIAALNAAAIGAIVVLARILRATGKAPAPHDTH